MICLLQSSYKLSHSFNITTLNMADSERTEREREREMYKHIGSERLEAMYCRRAHLCSTNNC